MNLAIRARRQPPTSRLGGGNCRPSKGRTQGTHQPHQSLRATKARFWEAATSAIRAALGLAEGEPKYDDLEKRLAEAPDITVPTITLEGDANGAPHADPSSYAKKFSGKYAHRMINGGIGQNPPSSHSRCMLRSGTVSAQSLLRER
jgi:hypothetical protein